jgi:hypothetical protein
MRRLLALSTVLTLGLVPAPAGAQGNGPCIHQGRQVQCPPGLPPGSQSIDFVPGGTNWRNSMTGAIVFVPGTTFPPFMPTPSPTAPPGPTTQPGPGQPPGGAPAAGAAPNSQSQIYLTKPADRDAGAPLPPPAELAKALRKRLAEADLKEAEAAHKDALKAYQGVVADLDVATGVYDPTGIAKKDRTIWVIGDFPNLKHVIIRITPEFRAAYTGYREAVEKQSRAPTASSQEDVLKAGSALEAAAKAAPIDQAATERLERAERPVIRAAEAAGNAREELEADSSKPQSLDGILRQGRLREVENSDAEKAPTFEPPGGDQKVEDVM